MKPCVYLTGYINFSLLLQEMYFAVRNPNALFKQYLYSVCLQFQSVGHVLSECSWIKYL